mmetsp:Transcript_3651/g.7469  ORF Transcript_3651/g.7469 Transcript_3651/m.7469 type:complete len:102 (+) Transcript_3651:301-606(+)
MRDSQPSSLMKLLGPFLSLLLHTSQIQWKISTKVKELKWAIDQSMTVRKRKADKSPKAPRKASLSQITPPHTLVLRRTLESGAHGYRKFCVVMYEKYAIIL